MDLPASLARLESAQLIRRAEGPDPSVVLRQGPDDVAGQGISYFFKHSMTQETAYESLLLKRRRDIHRRVAECVERLYADNLDESAAVLAQHYCEAGDDAKTVEYAIRAGDAAMRVYANTEAVAEYSLALQAATRTGADHAASLQQVYLKRGRALELLSRFDDAATNYDEMKAAADATGDRAFELAALIALATVRSIPGSAQNRELAAVLANQALQAARDLGDRKAEAKILWTLLLINIYGGGDANKAREYGEESLAIARELNLREQMAFTMNDLFVAYAYLGEMEKARNSRVESAKLWRELDNRPMLAESLSGLSLLSFLRGEGDQAVPLAQEAFEISKSIGNLGGQGFSGYVLGLIEMERGDFSQALKFEAEGIPIAKAGGLEGNGVSPYAMLGYIHAYLGDPMTARTFLHQTFGRASNKLPLQRMWLYALLTRIELMAGNLEAAEAAFRDGAVVASMDSFGRVFPAGAPQFYFSACELAIAQKDWPHGLDQIRALLEHLRQIKTRSFIPEAQFLEGKILLGVGDAEGAIAAWLAARAEAQAQNARRIWWQILLALARVQAASGKAEEADKLRAEACAIVEYIAAHAPPELRALFLSLPDVQSVVRS